MKKLFYFVCFMLICLSSLNNKVEAANFAPINLLDLSKFEGFCVMPDFSESATFHTLEKIPVVQGDVYSIICDREFLGRFDEDFIINRATLSYYNDNVLSSQDIITPVVKRYNSIYVLVYTFYPAGNNVMIDVFNTESSIGSNIVLIKGTFDTFIGFSAYVAPQSLYTTKNIKVNIEDMPTVNQLKSLISSKHSTSNSNLNVDVLSTTYNPDNKKVGNYELILSSSVLTVKRYYILNIEVVDKTSPVISCSKSTHFEIDFAKKPDFQTILSYLTISDNVDTLSVENLIFDKSPYDNAVAPSLVEVTFEVFDNSGNKGEITLNIDLVDKTPPEIIGPAKLFVYTTSTPLSNSYIIGRYTATDNVSTNISLFIEDNNYNQTKIPGSYGITIRAVDEAGNRKALFLIIEVVENNGAVFNDANLLLKLDSNNIYTSSQLLDYFAGIMLSASRDIKDPYIIFNGYQGHESEPGDYVVYIGFTENDLSYENKLIITVEEKVNNTNTIIIASVIGLALLASISTIIVKKRIKIRKRSTN